MVYAIVRLYASSHTYLLSSVLLLPLLNESSFSTAHNRNPLTSLHPMPNRLPTSPPLAVLVSELFRIIIFVSERHPRGSKLKLSFLAFTWKGERERGNEYGRQTETSGYEDGERSCSKSGGRDFSRVFSATSRLRFSVAAS